MKGVMSSWKCVPFLLFLLHFWHIYKTGINHQNSPQLQLQLNKSHINLKISLNCYKLDTSNLMFCCTPDIIICINHKKYTFNFQHESFTCKLRHLAMISIRWFFLILSDTFHVLHHIIKHFFINIFQVKYGVVNNKKR